MFNQNKNDIIINQRYSQVFREISINIHCNRVVHQHQAHLEGSEDSKKDNEQGIEKYGKAA